MADDGFAPAKVNLTLHVTGRRPDGYHLLDSLVAFAGVGDRVTARPTDSLSLAIEGPFAAGLDIGADNLVMRAAQALAPDRGVAIGLTKALPVASGIGGGSADAAATLRVLSALWGVPLPPANRLAGLGADVPVCLAGRPRRMRGIGELLDDVPALPPAWLVLANPGVPVPTPAVFAALTRRDGAPMPDRLPDWADAGDLARFLAAQRNDLEAAAITIAPVIGQVLTALGATDGCLIARMSGSGATCFGLYASETQARHAARVLVQPGWWVVAAPLLG